MLSSGASSQSRSADLAKLKSMSATMYRKELIEAARNTFCYRSELILKTGATFAECVVNVPCYITIPAIVSWSTYCCQVKLTVNVTTVAHI